MPPLPLRVHVPEMTPCRKRHGGRNVPRPGGAMESASCRNYAVPEAVNRKTDLKKHDESGTAPHDGMAVLFFFQLSSLFFSPFIFCSLPPVFCRDTAGKVYSP